MRLNSFFQGADHVAPKVVLTQPDKVRHCSAAIHVNSATFHPRLAPGQTAPGQAVMPAKKVSIRVCVRQIVA